MQTRSIGPMSCSTSCSTWPGSVRSARMPPWILGCSVLTRPPSISGAPVTSETGTTSIPASERARAVQPPEQRLFRILWQDRHPLLRDDGSGIDFLDHEVYRHPRLIYPGLECLLHG